MSEYSEDMLQAAHRRHTRDRDAIAGSKLCGCFYCQRTFESSEIKAWVHDEQVALCPKCSIDAVLGDSSGLPATTPAFLKAMRERWFKRGKVWTEKGWVDVSLA